MSFPQYIYQNDTVFLGDSLTESFDLLKHFGRDDLRNRGMSGDMTDHVLYRLEEITGAKPARIFLMIGINDIYQGYAADRIIQNIEKILSRFALYCPQTKVILQSILPVNCKKLFIEKSVNTDIYRINMKLKAIAEKMKIQFIDIHPDFLNNNGEMDEKYTYDGVHLTEEGYYLWADLIRDYLPG